MVILRNKVKKKPKGRPEKPRPEGARGFMPEGDRARFERLLDDAIFGVKKK